MIPKELSEAIKELFKYYGMQIVFLVFVIFFIAWIAFACSRINQSLGLKDDNIAEEIVEEIIEAKTGLDIDLTPSSPE